MTPRTHRAIPAPLCFVVAVLAAVAAPFLFVLVVAALAFCASATLAVPALAAPALAAPAVNTARNPERYSERYSVQLAAARAAYFAVLTSGSRSADRAAHAALASLEQSYPGDPTAEAYHGSLQLLDAAHNWQIWNLHREAADGLARLDHAVAAAPDDAEARFLRAATAWHLPAFYHRRSQCESDFAWLAHHAVASAENGTLPPALAAASFNYWGQILVQRGDSARARQAFRRAVQLAPQSPGAQDAARRLGSLR